MVDRAGDPGNRSLVPGSTAPPTAPLRVGVVVHASAGGDSDRARVEERTRTRLKALCRALDDVLSMDVRGRIAADYHSLLASMRTQDVDVAWLPPVIALRAAVAGAALPIIMPVREGVATFHTALFGHADTRFRRPTDLSEARAAWVDRQSASGYLIIRAALRAQGVVLEQAFSEEHVVGSHAAVVQAVREGAVDVGATYVHQSPDGKWTGWWDGLPTHVIARVGPIPNDVIAAGLHLPVSRTRAIRDALLQDGAVSSAAATLLEAERVEHADGSHLDELTRLMTYLDSPIARGRHDSYPAMKRSRKPT